MDRDKALAVLHEINAALRESVIVSGVSLDYFSQAIEGEIAKGYSIKMNCVFDSPSWERIKPILQENGLKMKADDKYVVIY